MIDLELFGAKILLFILIKPLMATLFLNQQGTMITFHMQQCQTLINLQVLFFSMVTLILFLAALADF